MTTYNRRDFLRTTITGGIAATCFSPVNAFTTFNKDENLSTCVALTSGDNRADLAFRALKPFSKQIRQAIGNRRVVLKPNNVLIDVPLTSTHVETLEGVLEFLKSINKLGNVIIAESAANGPTLDGFNNLNFCAQTRLGIADLNQIEIIGEKISNHIKYYKLNDNIDKQLVWINPVV